MIDYDISLCQLICPLCEEGKRLQNTWLAEVGYYYLISNREMVQALADKELEYWVNKIKETVNERLPD
jgi:predicted transcriptional regulator